MQNVDLCVLQSDGHQCPDLQDHCCIGAITSALHHTCVAIGERCRRQRGGGGRLACVNAQTPQLDGRLKEVVVALGLKAQPPEIRRRQRHITRIGETAASCVRICEPDLQMVPMAAHDASERLHQPTCDLAATQLGPQT